MLLELSSGGVFGGAQKQGCVGQGCATAWTWVLTLEAETEHTGLSRVSSLYSSSDG